MQVGPRNDTSAATQLIPPLTNPPCNSAGHETKAMLNNNGPRYKRSKLERQMNVDVFWCVIILLVMCLFAAVGM